MSTPAQLAPLNPELMDTIARGAEEPWIPLGDGSFLKVLWTGSESGAWAALFKWPAGYAAAPHKHLSAAHTFVLKGRLEIRDGELAAGDYMYERNGMIHDHTKALEDTEYLFICNGPLVFYDEKGITSHLGWEQMQRMKDAAAPSPGEAKAS